MFDSVVFKLLLVNVELFDGLNLYVILFDELYVQKMLDVWDVMEIVFGVCDQLLLFVIIIVGFIFDGICVDQW